MSPCSLRYIQLLLIVLVVLEGWTSIVLTKNSWTRCTVATLALAQKAPAPVFPLQFSATIDITAHLIEPDSDYPPHKRQMIVYYDYINKKARADIEAGFEAAKIYIRRYDEKNEYMVRLPPIDDCKRAYLGEVMPFPDIPEDTNFQGTEDIEGIECNYFLHTDAEVRVHMYFNTADGAPVRLLQEDTAGGVSTPLLTYDFSDVVLSAPPESWFQLQSPHEHKSCTRHVGGFPYLHIFHYFVRF